MEKLLLAQLQELAKSLYDGIRRLEDHEARLPASNFDGAELTKLRKQAWLTQDALAEILGRLR